MLCGIETRDYTLIGEARWSIHVICITTRRTIRSKRPTPRSWAFRRIGTRGRAVLRRRITFTGSGVAARRAFTDCRSVRVAGIKMQRTSLAARTCRLTSWRTRSQVDVDRLRLNLASGLLGLFGSLALGRPRFLEGGRRTPVRGTRCQFKLAHHPKLHIR